MVAKRHEALILVALILFLIAFSTTKIPETFAASQKSFVLNLDSNSFLFEENYLNDSSVSKEYNFPSSGNVTYWIRMPKNSTVSNATISLTGKIIYVYSVQASTSGIKGISIGNAVGTENQISFGTLETDGKAKLLYGNNGTYIWNSTVSSGLEIYSTSVGNVTSDAGSEIAVGSQDNKAYLLYSNGTKAWEFSTGAAVKSVKIGDVYGSGVNFVVAASDKVYVINSAGAENWSASITGCTGINDIALGNFTSDPGNEIVAGCGAGKIFILNSTGGTVTNMTVGSSSINSVDVENVTSDPGNEIAAGSGDNKVYIVNASGDTVWSYTTGGYVNSVKIDDVTSQYAGNEVVAGSNDKKVYTLDNNGGLIWSFEADSYIYTIAVGNLTSDSGKEVAAGAGNGYLYVFNFDYFPDNISIDAGGGGYDWSYTGKLRSAITAGGTAGFISAVQSGLTSCTPSGGLCNISLLFHSDWPGKLNISSINFTYSYNISNLVYAPIVNSVWSRTVNINVNESVGYQVRNISFISSPAAGVQVTHIRTSQSATATCDFNGSSYSVVTAEGQVSCNVPDFTIPSSGSLPGPFTLWDNTMTTGTPVIMAESDAYYTYTTNDFSWRKNLTIWNATSTAIYNVTGNFTLNETAVKGQEFLNVSWRGSWCSLTPSTATGTCNTASPSYTAMTCLGQTFYACKQDTNANGVYDFFRWVQPYANSSVSYIIGGTTNLVANLSGQNVTASSIWGSWFNYSANVSDTESDYVNVTLWVRLNITGAWQAISEQNVSGESWFNTTSSQSWVGLASYMFQYQDFNSSGYPMHSSQNTSVFSGPLVLKHSTSVELAEGNNSEVNRSSSVLLSARINDTSLSEWAGSGVNCSFWVTTDGSIFGQPLLNTSNSSGYCEYLLIPGSAYSPGNQTWKAGVLNDTYYSDANSTNFLVSVKARINITLVAPESGQTLYRNYSNSLLARMVDEYGSGVQVSGYNCTFWLTNSTGSSELGNSNTNSSGWCILSWDPGCSASLGQFTINVTLEGNASSFYYIESQMNSNPITMKDRLLTQIYQPAAGSYYHKGDTITLSSTTNDTCSLCSQPDYQLSWSLKWKQHIIITLNESKGYARTNETIIINGTELESLGIDLSDWRVNYTKVLLNGQEVPFHVKAWTSSAKTQVNESQTFLNNYSELVFIVNIGALQSVTYHVYYNESTPAASNLSFIRNGGFENGMSSWTCLNGSACDQYNLCDCSATTGNGEASGNYSLRLLVNPNTFLANVNMSVQQDLGMQVNSSYIKVRYKPVMQSSGSSYIRLYAGSGTCSLSTTPSAWTETLCANSSFQSASSVSVRVYDATQDGTASYVYIDYICVADSSGNCASIDSGFGPVKTVYSQDSVGTGNATWEAPLNETLGLRTLLANSSGSNHTQNFSTSRILLFGWSNVSGMNLSSGYCTTNQTTECMSNATIDFSCRALDVNTSLGILDYNVSFFLNGSYLGSNMTNLTGYSTFRWLNSTDTVGTYNVSCNTSGTIYEPNTYYNQTSDNGRFMVLDIISGNTTAEVMLSPLTASPSGITRESNYTFYLNVTINNTGNGTMYSPSVSISSPAGISVQPISCPSIIASSACSSSLQVNVTQSAEVRDLFLNVTASWSNADSTQANATNSTLLSVENNTVLNLTQTQLIMNISRGDSRVVGNFTVEAYGNTPLTNGSFSIAGGNSSTLQSWISYSQSLLDVTKASSQQVNISLAVPSNATEGVYTATLTANATGSSCSPASECWDTLALSINVTHPDWDMAPSNLSKTIGLSGDNGSIGYITVTSNQNQNYSFQVNVSGNGSAYISASRSTFSLSPSSSATIYVYHNATGAYLPGYWFANVTMTSLNNTFPSSMNTSVYLNVINLTLQILSPNQSVSTSPVNASQRINITVNATLSGVAIGSDMTWVVTVGGQSCGDVQSSFSGDIWEINCTAPNITGNTIYNTLSVTGNYTAMEGTIVSDSESNAVKYVDITPPQPYGVTVSPVNYYSSTPYINITATITDNTGVNSSWLVITQPNGTNVSVYDVTNSSTFYYFNFSNPNSLGDYVVHVFCNDSQGYSNSTPGWFDVYLPFTMSGTLQNPSSANQSVNFTFYRNGTSTVIHTLYTNSSQASYNWSVHDRNYDILISAFGHNVVLYGVNTTASARSQYNASTTNLTGGFRFDDFPTRTSSDISNFDLPNTGQNIILGFVIETPNLSYSTASITIDYTTALAAALQTITVDESDLRIFRCTNWNFQSRTCSAGEFSHFNESLTPDTSANTFTFTSTPSTAYAIAESCYPNICGQSQTLPTVGPSSSTGSSGSTAPTAVCGNGKCETGENSQNCPQDCPADADPFTIKTGITNIRLRPGDKATYPFSITNKLNKTITAEISVSGLESYLTLQKSSVQIAQNQTSTFDIYVSVPETVEAGTYTGIITVSAEGKTKDVPVNMVIGLEGRSQLNLVLTLLTKKLDPNGELKFTTELRNIGYAENLTVQMIYTVRNSETEEIIMQENETVDVSLGTGESVVFNKGMSFQGTDTPMGQYYLEVVATFGHRFVRDVEYFEVTQAFWITPFGQFATWFVIVGAIIAMAYYERRRYRRWKMKKSRYIFPMNYAKLPQENDDAFWVGRVAETDKKAWFNPNDLSTHVLVAGSTGSGKSVSASIFVEEALEKKIPVVVFDPTAQWTGFVKQCEDENLLKYYKMFGMDERYAKPFKGMIFEITDPHVTMDFKKYMVPGEITVFTMNKLGPGEYDVAVKNIINAIFRTGWEESTKLRMIMVFDEVHRLLEKYGGIGGYTSLEQACREFRKWGIGIIMCSQVLADFKEAISGNVLTDIQMNTKSLVDIRKVETKYGQEYANRISRQGVGVGMVQNPKYNDGKPYFVQFRPTWHNPHKITDEDLQFYKEFAQRLEVVEQRIMSMKKSGKDTSDIEIELKLAKDKLKQGRFRMAKIYVNSLEEHLDIKQER